MDTSIDMATYLRTAPHYLFIGLVLWTATTSVYVDFVILFYASIKWFSSDIFPFLQGLGHLSLRTKTLLLNNNHLRLSPLRHNLQHIVIRYKKVYYYKFFVHI